MLRSSSIFKKDSITSLAIGGFDGMHTAHRELISRLDDNGALLIVEKGFDEALTPKERRCDHTSLACFFLDFERIKEISAEAFVDYLHAQFPALRKIVVGYDFRFGKSRRGTPELFQRISGVEVEVVEEQKREDVSVHAGEIRKLLKEGKPSLAAKLLGRPYSIEGMVVSGQGLGKKALYPTFNLAVEAFLIPAEGVYISEAKVGEKYYPAVTFVGHRVSTDRAFSIETHLLTERPLPEVKTLEVRFLRYLRPNRKFDSLEALKLQIGKDIEAARGYFEAQA